MLLFIVCRVQLLQKFTIIFSRFVATPWSHMPMGTHGITWDTTEPHIGLLWDGGLWYRWI